MKIFILLITTIFCFSCNTTTPRKTTHLSTKIIAKSQDSILQKSGKFTSLEGNRPDGFYVVLNNPESHKDAEAKISEQPSITTKDIQNVVMGINPYQHSPEINIEFTKKGAEKFRILTIENIGKPLAIVIANQIVSMPIIQSEIANGKVSINGDFSMEEMDYVVRRLGE